MYTFYGRNDTIKEWQEHTCVLLKVGRRWEKCIVVVKGQKKTNKVIERQDESPKPHAT